jgi:hypothetical protein
MLKETGLLVGTVIFIILGIVAAIVFYSYIKMKSPPHQVAANRQYLFNDIEWAWCLC